VGAVLDSFEQLTDVVITQPWGKAKRARCDREGLRVPVNGCVQTDAKIVVDGLLEGHSGATNFLAQELRNIVIQREGGSHITMISILTS